ncbi:TPA: restriction endonuclease subunit S, partial [Salmonella enterica subsp. enterica serovar Virchow]
MAVEKLIVDHIDTWTTALQTRSTAGRGSSGKIDLYGIKKLRELILELAVHGKLVPQDPNDEPASVLLERIAAEKAELVKQGKIKKQKPLPEISEEEKPFELPVGWEWVRLGDIGETNIGLTYSPNNIKETGTPVLRSSNIQNGILDFTDLVRVSGMEIKNSSYVEDGDLLICARNGSKTLVGKNALINSLSEPMAFGAFMAIFRCSYNNYVKIFLDSPSFRRNLDGVDTTTINQITQS